jgi:hypothetical protein
MTILKVKGDFIMWLLKNGLSDKDLSVVRDAMESVFKKLDAPIFPREKTDVKNM